ncbi:Hypothetical protein, putative, partial [Bodo saltans]
MTDSRRGSRRHNQGKMYVERYTFVYVCLCERVCTCMRHFFSFFPLPSVYGSCVRSLEMEESLTLFGVYLFDENVEKRNRHKNGLNVRRVCMTIFVVAKKIQQDINVKCFSRGRHPLTH